MCNMKALSPLVRKLWPMLKFLFTHQRRRRHQGYDISSPDIRPGSLKYRCPRILFRGHKFTRENVYHGPFAIEYERSKLF